ncbi:MAG: amidohydrolase family protein [Thermomicrobiales bacterium]
MLAIDCNTFFGVRPDQRTDYAVATLAGMMTESGVAGALTLSLRGVHYDHQLGNQETLDVCRRYPQLIPVATINLARHVGWREDVDWCLTQGFRAFRFFPATQHWSVRDAGFRQLCERLAPAKTPLFFTIADGNDANEIAERTADLGLPVVLLQGAYANESVTIALAQRYPHIHLDVTRRGTPHIVRYLIDQCGIDRVLFGTNAPQNCMQPAMNSVFVADLPAAQTEQILSRNVLCLLNLARTDLPDGVTEPVAAEPQYRGYPGPTIDMHAHLGPWRFPILTRDTETMLDYARRYNLEKIIISSALGITYDMGEGNRELKELIDPHPELLGYVVTNPNFVEESAAEMDHYYRYPNFVGAKIHAEYAATPTAAPRMAALFAEIAKRGRPVKIHNAGPDWLHALRDLARKHPDLPIVLAHGGSFGTPAFIKETPNISLEYCRSSSLRGLIRKGLETLGPDRLMFGTDQDLFDPGYAFGAYHDAGFTEREAEQVMYSNAKRVFGLD